MTAQFAIDYRAAPTAADAFLCGKPAVYTGFNGNLLIARYARGDRNGIGVGSITISNPAGRELHNRLMGECGARSFFWNLDAQGED